MKDLYVFTPHFRAISGKVRSGFSRAFSRVFTHKQVDRAWLFGDRVAVVEKPRALWVRVRGGP